MEPIKVYREGEFDRRYWYTIKTKQFVARKAHRLGEHIDSIFIEHKLAN